MSWQAQTAVTRHSKQTNISHLRLLLYLAEGANETGMIDPAPSQETLAAFSGCTDRTIRTRLSDLIDSGELIQTRVGSGPGNSSAYLINLPMPTNAKVEAKVEDNANIVSTFQALMVEVKAEIDALKVEIETLKVEISEAKGGKGGSERWKAHSFKNADDPLRSIIDPEEENIYTSPDSEPIASIKTAITKICKQPLWDKTREDYDSAAYVLLGYDATPETITSFGRWWDVNGFYPGKPSLKSIMDEYQNFLAGVTKRNTNGNGHAGKNGTTKSIADLTKEAMEELENGVW